MLTVDPAIIAPEVVLDAAGRPADDESDAPAGPTTSADIAAAFNS